MPPNFVPAKRKHARTLVKVQGHLPLSWWPRSLPTAKEVLHCFAPTRTGNKKKLSPQNFCVVNYLESDFAFGMATFEMGGTYISLVFNKLHEAFVLQRLDEESVMREFANPESEHYQGDENKTKLLTWFPPRKVTSDDQDNDDESCDSSSDSGDSE